MADDTATWTAEPLIWGDGPHLFEAFLEPTCPFSKRAFGRIFKLVEGPGAGRVRARIWLHSQPWHMFSGVLCRAIAAASTGPEGKEAARKVMTAIYADREGYEFDDHRSGPNLDQTPNGLLSRLEADSGVALAEAFQISGLEAVVKQHTRYARQNGIHVSPTFMVNGLIDPSISSGDAVDDWAAKILG